MRASPRAGACSAFRRHRRHFAGVPQAWSGARRSVAFRKGHRRDRCRAGGPCGGRASARQAGAGHGGLRRHPVRRAAGSLRRARAGRGLGRDTGRPVVRATASPVRLLRHGRPGCVRRGLADGQRADARSDRKLAGDGVDPGWRLPIRYVRPARVRRRQAGAGRRRCPSSRSATGSASRDSPGSKERRRTVACSTRSQRWDGYETTSARSAGITTASRYPASPRVAGPWPRCWRCRQRPGCPAARSCRACRSCSSPPELAAGIAVAFAAEPGLRPTELATVAPRTLPAGSTASLLTETDRRNEAWGALHLPIRERLCRRPCPAWFCCALIRRSVTVGCRCSEVARRLRTGSGPLGVAKRGPKPRWRARPGACARLRPSSPVWPRGRRAC